PYQVQDTRQGRACDRGHQTGVRLCQGALSRAHQEHPPPARDLRTGQSVYGAPPSIARPTGVICLTSPLTVADAADPSHQTNDTHTPTVSLADAVSLGYLFLAPCSEPSLTSD